MSALWSNFFNVFNSPAKKKSSSSKKRRLVSMGSSSRWNHRVRASKHPSATFADDAAGFGIGSSIIWITASSHASAAIDDGATIICCTTAIVDGTAAFNTDKRTEDYSNAAYIASGTAACLSPNGPLKLPCQYSLDIMLTDGVESSPEGSGNDEDNEGVVSNTNSSNAGPSDWGGVSMDHVIARLKLIKADVCEQHGALYSSVGM